MYSKCSTPTRGKNSVKKWHRQDTPQLNWSCFLPGVWAPRLDSPTALKRELHWWNTAGADSNNHPVVARAHLGKQAAGYLSAACPINQEDVSSLMCRQENFMDFCFDVSRLPITGNPMGNIRKNKDVSWRKKFWFSATFKGGWGFKLKFNLLLFIYIKNMKALLASSVQIYK